MDEPPRPSETIRLAQPLLRTAGLFGASVIWLAFGGYLFAVSHSAVALILALVGLTGAVVYGLALIPGGSYLEAGPSGLAVSASFRRRAHAWSEIEGFSVRHLSRKKKMVRYRLAPRTGETRAREELLPDTYGLSAEELAERLNDLRRRYAALDGDATP